MGSVGSLYMPPEGIRLLLEWMTDDLNRSEQGHSWAQGNILEVMA